MPVNAVPELKETPTPWTLPIWIVSALFVAIVAPAAALAVIRFEPLVESERPPFAVSIIPEVKVIAPRLELSEIPPGSLNVEVPVTEIGPPAEKAREPGAPPTVN